MSSVLDSDPATTATSAFRSQRLLAWFCVAALAAPVTVVLHELGHYLVGAAFGFPDLVLRYGSVGSTAAEQGFPSWQLGLQAAAGPLVTVLITLLCCFYVSRRGQHRLAIATGLVAPIRFVIGVVYLGYAAYVWLRGGRMEGTNFDEYNVARASGIRLEILLGLEVLFMVGAWWYLAMRIERRERWVTIFLVGAGMVLGFTAWLFAGPWLLP